jgi:hypothetical protein
MKQDNVKTEPYLPIILALFRFWGWHNTIDNCTQAQRTRLRRKNNWSRRLHAKDSQIVDTECATG